LLLLLAAIGGYIVFHNYKYSECLLQPGIFSGPSQCI
jgi:hypothetical protein